MITDFTLADQILLHDGIPLDIERIIDGVNVEPGGGGITLHCGETDIVLLGYR